MIYVAELEPGISDDAVLDIANRESAVLVTADKDFGEIVFRQGRSSGGVVLIRLEGLSPEGKARTVSAAINTHLEEIPEISRFYLRASSVYGTASPETQPGRP